MIGVITATRDEYEALQERLVKSAAAPVGKCPAADEAVGQAAATSREAGSAQGRYCHGVLGEEEVVFVQCGVGKVNAALCAQEMIDRFAPEKMIMVGVAGALNQDLHVGDVVISKDCVQHDFDITFFGVDRGEITVNGVDMKSFQADEELIGKAENAAESLGCRHIVGRVLTGDQFICTEEKKQELIREFHGDCAEMEGGAIAQACVASGVPFVVLRAISDGASDGATMQYDDFVKLAAKKAADLVETMLS